MFEKFDEDGSGTMEINELHTMFKKNGIEMTMDELFKIFKIVDADGNGSLSLDEFQLYAYDKNAQERFRDIIREVRLRIDHEFQNRKVPEKQFFPSDFNNLLSFLYDKTQHN